MPYEIRKSGKKYCVYNKQTNDNKGCSDSKKEAVNHMRALYAAESKLNPSEAKMAAEQVELEEFVAELETELGIELDEDTDTLDTRESDSVDPVEFDAVVAELEAELGIELDADGEDLVATIAHFGYIEDALYHLNILKSMPLSHEALVHVEEAMVALAEYEDAPEEKVTGVALSEPLQISDAPVSTDSMEEFPWEGPIVFEGVMTGDNRLFKKDAIQWEPDTLPWAFRWQKHSDQGHGGAVPVGRVDKIQRFDDGSIHGYGVVIPALSEEASEYLRLLQSGVGGGVSVDGDSAQFDIVDDPKIKAPPKTEFSYMRLRALSAVDVPAFNHARIHLIGMPATGESAVPSEAENVAPELNLTDEAESEIQSEEVTESHGWNMDGLVASAIPVQPSIEAFVDPEFSGPTALTVTKDGRVFGHLALFNTCHIGFPGTCVKPPKGSKYQYFHTGQIETAEGDFVDVGHLTFKTGHAPMQANPKMAAEHYDNTGTVAADVRAGEDKYGIWVVGALRSHLSDEDIRAFRAAPLSGDWRRISGKLELVGALAVNVPGFPVPRARAMVASGQTETLFTFLEDNNEEFAGDDYELKLRLDKKASLSKRIFPQIDTIAADGNIEGTILGETVDGLISDYELQLRYDKKLALIKKMGNYEDVQFAQSLDDFISTKDNEVPTGDSLPNPDSLPDLPNIPTKQDIVKRAKNYTKSQFLHDLQDLRDLLDDPEEKIKASDRKSLEALYAMFVNTDKTGKKVTTAGENLEEFYNKCHGPGGKFCSTGGGGGGGGTGKGVTGRHFVPNIKPGNPGHEHTHEKGAGGGKPGGGGGGNKGGNQGQNKGGGGDRYAQYKADAVKDLSNYRKATISARRWFSTATIATVADLAVHGGFPLAKIVGPLVPGILVTPAGLTALIGIGLFVGGKQVIASRQHKAAFKATIDKINKTQKIDEQIRRLHASKP